MNSSTQCKPTETKRTYTVDEIAKILNIPAGTVSARLKRGREQLEAAIRGKEVMDR